MKSCFPAVTVPHVKKGLKVNDKLLVLPHYIVTTLSALSKPYGTTPLPLLVL